MKSYKPGRPPLGGTVQGNQRISSPWGAGSREGHRGRGQIRLLPRVSQEPPPGPRPPEASLPHCGGSAHRDRAPGQGKPPLPSGPIEAAISGDLTAAGCLAWVSEMDERGPSRAPRSLLLVHPLPLPPGTT